MSLHPSLVVLRAFTIFFTIGVLFYRRRTLRLTWERGVTIQLALQCAGLWLCGPLATYLLSGPLQRLTGENHVEDLCGGLCYVVSCAVIAMNFLQRVARDDAEAQALVNLYVQPVAALAVAVMLPSFWFSNAKDGSALELLQVHEDWWLRAYWCALYSACAALLAVSLWALSIISADPNQRYVARDWRNTLWFGQLACAAGIVNAFVDYEIDWFIWWGAALVALGSAVIAARSWYRQMRSVRTLLRYTRTKRAELRADTLESHRLRILLSAESIIDQAYDAHATSPHDDDGGPRPLQSA